MKIGILIRMMPDDLQDIILQHADRLKEYKLVKENAVNLIDTRERLRDPNAMDISYVDDKYFEEEVGAVGRDTKCYRCGGQGHLAAHCATPKGDGKGFDKSFGGKGYGKNGKGFDYGGKGYGKTRATASGSTRGSAARGMARTAKAPGSSATIAARPATVPTAAGRSTLNSCRGRGRRQSTGKMKKSTTSAGSTLAVPTSSRPECAL